MTSQQEYLADPYRFMRAVSASDAHVAIQRLAAGDPVDDLVQEFPGWDHTDLWPGKDGAGGEPSGQGVDAHTVIELPRRQNEILRSQAREAAGTTDSRKQIDTAGVTENGGLQPMSGKF